MNVTLELELHGIMDIEDYVSWSKHRIEMADAINDTSLIMQSGQVYYAVCTGDNVEVYKVTSIEDIHHVDDLLDLLNDEE